MPNAAFPDRYACAAATITSATTDREGTEWTGAILLARHHVRTDWHSRSCRCGDLVGQRAARGKVRDASQRRVQNRPQSLAREECLMPGHDHVRERDEALDHVVRNHRARQILEEEAGLLFVHVDRYPAELAGLQR